MHKPAPVYNMRIFFLNCKGTPDLIIVDSAEEKSMRSHHDYYLVRVTSEGNVRWQYQTMTKSFCQINIMNFPFDEQVGKQK